MDSSAAQPSQPSSPRTYKGLSIDHFFYDQTRQDGTGRSLYYGWEGIRRAADLRPTDTLLDVGCAEGLITMEAAKLVKQAHGVEYYPFRVEMATEVAKERGINNITFEQGSIFDFNPGEMTYDVVMMLAVLWCPASSKEVEIEDFERMLRAARRHFVLRTDLQSEKTDRLERVAAAFERNGFDWIAFRQTDTTYGGLVFGNRRGAGGKLKEAARVALMPTAQWSDHPMLQGVPIAADEAGAY